MIKGKNMYVGRLLKSRNHKKVQKEFKDLTFRAVVTAYFKYERKFYSSYFVNLKNFKKYLKFTSAVPPYKNFFIQLLFLLSSLFFNKTFLS